MRYWIELALNNGAAWYLNYLVLSTIVFGALWALTRKEWVSASAENGMLRVAVILVPLLAGLRVALAHTDLSLPSGPEVAMIAGRGGWTAIAVITAACLVGWAHVGRLALAVRLEGARLRDRADLARGPVHAEFCDLVESAPPLAPRLTHSASIHAPLVLRSGEICVPSGISAQLTPTEIRAVLVHELSHVERRDGRWTVLSQILGKLFVLQPLHQWVARRIRETAEFVADERSSAACGSPEPLVRALTAFARSEPPRGGTPGFAPGSLLYRRVRRVLQGGVPANRSACLAAGGYFMAALTLAWFAPGFAPACDCLLRLFLP